MEKIFSVVCPEPRSIPPLNAQNVVVHGPLGKHSVGSILGVFCHDYNYISECPAQVGVLSEKTSTISTCREGEKGNGYWDNGNPTCVPGNENNTLILSD